MRTLRNAVLGGAAAAALGFSGAALAQTPATHVLTVALPGGGVAQIRYTGDVAPRVVFTSAPQDAAWAPMAAFFSPDAPFATLDRISAEMDRQAAAMFQQSRALAHQAQSGRLTEAGLQRLPPGSSSYTFVSTMSGSGVCSESVQITAPGNGAPPRVVRYSSGNCGAPAGGSMTLPTATPPVTRPGPVWTSAPSQLPYAAPVPARRPDAVWTSAHGAKPYAALVHEIPPAQR